MSRSPRQRVYLVRSALVVVVFGVLFVTPVDAAPSRARVARARAIFAKANMLYKLAKFREALHRYEAVYKLVPRPSALFNIANCYRHLGQRDKALFYYKLFIDEWEAKNPKRQVPELEIARNHIEVLQRAKPAPKSVPKPAPKSVPKPAPKSVPKPAPKSVPKPAPKPVVITSAPPTPPAKPRLTTPALVPLPSSSTSRQSPPVYKRWWFWTLIGVAVAGGATAVGIVASRSDDRVPRGTPIDWGSFKLGVSR